MEAEIHQITENNITADTKINYLTLIYLYQINYIYDIKESKQKQQD